jgi:hypothetical protein
MQIKENRLLTSKFLIISFLLKMKNNEKKHTILYSVFSSKMRKQQGTNNILPLTNKMLPAIRIRYLCKNLQ